MAAPLLIVVAVSDGVVSSIASRLGAAATREAFVDRLLDKAARAAIEAIPWSRPPGCSEGRERADVRGKQQRFPALAEESAEALREA